MCLGSSVMDRVLDCSKATKDASVSPSQLVFSTHEWAREEFSGSWTGALGHSRLASEGVRVENRVNFSGLSLSIKDGSLGCSKATVVSSVRLGEEVRMTSGGLGLTMELDVVKAQEHDPRIEPKLMQVYQTMLPTTRGDCECKPGDRRVCNFRFFKGICGFGGGEVLR